MVKKETEYGFPTVVVWRSQWRIHGIPRGDPAPHPRWWFHSGLAYQLYLALHADNAQFVIPCQPYLARVTRFRFPMLCGVGITLKNQVSCSLQKHVFRSWWRDFPSFAVRCELFRRRRGCTEIIYIYPHPFELDCLFPITLSHFLRLFQTGHAIDIPRCVPTQSIHH